MDDPADIGFRKFWKRIRQTHSFDDCLHPNRKSCQGKIIACHSIQRNRYLRNISEDGYVAMFDHAASNQAKLSLVGIKKATTFNGFCAFHDKTVFQAIEDCEQETFSIRQCFLFAYRAFAREFAAKRAFLSIARSIRQGNPLSNLTVRNNILGERDTRLNKAIFDKCLLTKDQTDFVFRQRVIQGSYPLAVSALASIDRNLGGDLIYDTIRMTNRVPVLSLTVLPQKASLTVIVSYFRQDSGVYQKLIDEVFSMADDRFLQVLSYWTLTYAENWAISPSLAKSWPELTRKQIEGWFEVTIGPTLPYLEFVRRVGSIF